MDGFVNKMKTLIKNGGDRFIVVDNNEPTFVILSLSEYEQLVNGKSSNDEKNIQLGKDQALFQDDEIFNDLDLSLD
ncbi:MAG: hypothetical protein HYV52_03550 [Parcubacteria group bacterium]|nr:hypothetical protein [Parcubacteria group bacterium]